MSIFYDLVHEDELEDAHKIESQGYPEDEAGGLETFRYRQSQAPELFLGAYLPSDAGRGRRLIGYVCSTLSPDTTLTHESMAKHIPGSSSVCIHSVCVDREHRRQKLGLGLVREYVSRLSASSTLKPPERILLIAHEELRGFYEQAGFEWLGRSAVVHGARPWFEMRKVLKPAIESEPQRSTSISTSLGSGTVPSQTLPNTGNGQGSSELESAPAPQAPAQIQQPASASVPPGLWEALQRQSSRARPLARLLTSFPNAVQDVTSDIAADAAHGLPSNRFDLLCPRLGCGSVILKAGVASWVERASVALEPQGAGLGSRALAEALGPLPEPPATAQWWLVRGSAMVFENIGFSKPVETQETGLNGKRMKLLACAECDLGPLGWCEEGGSEYWLACNRVGYRA